MSTPILNQEAWLKAVTASRAGLQVGARAMYSSWWQGIITDPALMLLPMDEHMVHRGDGIFEAARVVDGAFFDLDAHLQRLARSAEQVSLKLPFELNKIKQLCIETARAAKLKQAALRLFVGRGPGSYSPNPYDCPNSQLYIIITEFKALPESKYQSGVRAMISKVPQKNPFYARIKSCNYLPNVLMKKESVDAGLDFSLGCSEHGVVYEGATENLAIYGADKVLRVPKFDYTLKGTTLMAVLDSLKASPDPSVQSIEHCDLNISDLLQAKEAFMIGTTLEVLPLVEIIGKPVGTGHPGPVAANLRKRLHKLMREDSQKRTEID